MNSLTKAKGADANEFSDKRGGGSFLMNSLKKAVVVGANEFSDKGGGGGG